MNNTYKTCSSGCDRVIQFADERFYGLRMQNDITHYITHVCSCIKQKRPHVKTKAPLKHLTSFSPSELVSIDYLHLEKSSGGFEYILVVMDHFTQFAHVYPTRNKSGTTSANKTYNNFILKYGFPARIHHDQAAEFEKPLVLPTTKHMWDKAFLHDPLSSGVTSWTIQLNSLRHDTYSSKR